MRAAIESKSGETADGKLEREKRHFAVREQPGHERVSFGCQVQVNPKQCELSIQPVQSKQQQAFRECAHRKHLR